MDKNLYNYEASLLKVIDGDTIEVVVDLGFDVLIAQTVRIAGIDTPEIRTSRVLEKQAGMKVKNCINEQLKDQIVYLTTHKPVDKYGRYLANIFTNSNGDETSINLSEVLIKMGFAHAYDGKVRQRWTDEELQNILNCEIQEGK